MDGRTSATGDGLTASVHVANLAGNFVTLADTLSDEFEMDRHLGALVRACLTSLPVTAAAVVLLDGRGWPSVAVASDDEVGALERLQLRLGYGPVLECLSDGGASVVVRLAEESDRWPAYVQKARAAGFEMAQAIPLRQGQETLGALGLYDPGRHHVQPEHLRVAEALARVATIGIVQHRRGVGSKRRTDELQSALSTRVVIEQAKGVLSERGRISPEESFDRLRAYARSARAPLRDVAAAVVERRLAADEVLGDSRPPG